MKRRGTSVHSSETFSQEELAPMVLAWGRDKPVRCARCAAYDVKAQVIRRESGARSELVLSLTCRQCGRRGEAVAS